ncbi:formate dehydrogenase accessory sulfurtransferase FdhD [Bradyrhizobium sp. I71]|uniref:formate dehydrogenase accessory sulfurtransferase FdhD n=1 Tax=Bradyrhizobium sp. I71 TaxID=2590772 RepID=UPI001EF83A23|nr:formate dehydrogenase accessory sulfurtransferase FdhD [Bradyrhizobium sp. I71]
MATPTDLTDLARGFSLTEGIIRDLGEIEELTVVPGPDGIELGLWLRPDAGRRLKERRRQAICGRAKSIPDERHAPSIGRHRSASADSHWPSRGSSSSPARPSRSSDHAYVISPAKPSSM